MLGIASSLGLIPNPFVSKPPRTRGIHNYDDEEESAEEEVDELGDGILDHAPNWANGYDADKRDGLRARTQAARDGEKKNKPAASKEVPEWANSQEECKLVLVVRTDLGMTKGRDLPPLLLLFPLTPCSLHILSAVITKPNSPHR